MAHSQIRMLVNLQLADGGPTLLHCSIGIIPVMSAGHSGSTSMGPYMSIHSAHSDRLHGTRRTQAKRQAPSIGN